MCEQDRRVGLWAHASLLASQKQVALQTDRSLVAKRLPNWPHFGEGIATHCVPVMRASTSELFLVCFAPVIPTVTTTSWVTRAIHATGSMQCSTVADRVLVDRPPALALVGEDAGGHQADRAADDRRRSGSKTHPRPRREPKDRGDSP